MLLLGEEVRCKTCHRFFTALELRCGARPPDGASLPLSQICKPSARGGTLGACVARPTDRSRAPHVRCGGVRAGVRAMKHEGLLVLLLRVLAEMGCVFGGTFGGGNSRAFP